MALRPFVLATGLLCCTAAGQETLWRVEGVLNRYLVGGLLAFVGDVDGDGTADLASTRMQLTATQIDISILSGRDGSLLRVDLPPSWYCVSQLVSAGDMDGDGVDDYACSLTALASVTNFVEVRSGATGAVLWQVQGPRRDEFGRYLAGNLDVDRDGKLDLVVAAPRENNFEGAVYAYGNQGRLLFRRPGPISRFMWSLGSLAGDFDGDGADDYLIGAPADSGRGSVLVYSGRTGELLTAGFGDPGDGIGIGNVLGCGDIDGDGVLDFIGSSHGGFMTPGVVRVFSGKTAQPIYTWRQPVLSQYGLTAAVGDLDLDGVQDLLVGASSCGLEWRSLRDGSLIKILCGPPQGGTGFGRLVAIGAPQPGHPFPVIAISEPSFAPFMLRGRLHLFRATPAGVAGLGPACTGTLGAAPQLGFTDMGARGVRVHLSNAPAGAPALLLLGLSGTNWLGTPLPLALDPYGLAGCSLYTSIDVAAAVTAGTTGIDAGYASFDLPLPIATGTPQLTVHGQWLVLGRGAADPGALSGGLSWNH